MPFFPFRAVGLDPPGQFVDPPKEGFADHDRLRREAEQVPCSPCFRGYAASMGGVLAGEQKRIRLFAFRPLTFRRNDWYSRVVHFSIVQKRISYVNQTRAMLDRPAQ